MTRWHWEAAAAQAGIDADGRFNAGALPLTADRALLWHRADESVKTYSGSDLEALGRWIAGALRHAGVRRGDRVAGLMGRRPEALALAVAAWRLGAIYVPLFSGFGVDSLRVRLADSGAAYVVTDSANRPGLDLAREGLRDLAVIVVGERDTGPDHSLDDLMERVGERHEIESVHRTYPATIMYTSGTSGTPKGCVIPHHGVVSLWPYVEHCLAVGPGSVLFSTADTGWSFGLYTTGLGPMTRGATRVLYQGGFDPQLWWQAVEQHGVTDFASAPTGYRQMAAAGIDVLGGTSPTLVAATSAGEPLTPAVIRWFEDNFRLTIHDSYGLTELGMVIANLRGEGALPPAAGSMGFALPGYDVALLDGDGNHLRGEATGRIAVKDNGYLLGSGYWGRQDEWDRRVEDGWWVTEDVASRDDEGRFWYVGRNDDVIVTAGYNVGPFEVENALMEHPLIVDAACIGEPDERKGHVVIAHVVLDEQGDEPDDLLAELRPWVGERIGWHAAPRRVTKVDGLPRTESGKVRRNALRGSIGGAG